VPIGALHIIHYKAEVSKTEMQLSGIDLNTFRLAPQKIFFKVLPGASSCLSDRALYKFTEAIAV